jgi:hypothetical protein
MRKGWVTLWLMAIRAAAIFPCNAGMIKGKKNGGSYFLLN